MLEVEKLYKDSTGEVFYIQSVDWIQGTATGIQCVLVDGIYKPDWTGNKKKYSPSSGEMLYSHDRIFDLIGEVQNEEHTNAVKVGDVLFDVNETEIRVICVDLLNIDDLNVVGLEKINDKTEMIRLFKSEMGSGIDQLHTEPADPYKNLRHLMIDDLVYVKVTEISQGFLIPAHFAGFDEKTGKPTVFRGGTTSATVGTHWFGSRTYEPFLVKTPKEYKVP